MYLTRIMLAVVYLNDRIFEWNLHLYLQTTTYTTNKTSLHARISCFGFEFYATYKIMYNVHTFTTHNTPRNNNHFGNQNIQPENVDNIFIR